VAQAASWSAGEEMTGIEAASGRITLIRTRSSHDLIVHINLE
jgi:hypothetical protein